MAIMRLGISKGGIRPITIEDRLWALGVFARGQIKRGKRGMATGVPGGEDEAGQDADGIGEEIAPFDEAAGDPSLVIFISGGKAGQDNQDYPLGAAVMWSGFRRCPAAICQVSQQGVNKRVQQFVLDREAEGGDRQRRPRRGDQYARRHNQ